MLAAFVLFGVCYACELSDWSLNMLRKRVLSFLPIINHSTGHDHLKCVHFWIIVTTFAGLGFFVGMWTVLLADLAGALQLSPVLLGIALSSFSSAGIVALASGSYLAARLSRRAILLIGIVGMSIFLVVLSSVSQFAILLIVLICGGVCTSCYDLAVNTLGGDYERRYQCKTMATFHAGFSGGAAPGAFLSALALSAGIGFRTIYIVGAVLFLVLGLVAAWCPLPSDTSTAELTVEAYEVQEEAISSTTVMGLLTTPIVMLAITLVCLSFFTDGALEGYISIYLRNLLGSGVLLGGVGIAAYHLTGFLGRLGSAAALRRYGERRVITSAGLLTLLGMLLALATTYSPLAVVGLLLVGIGQSPTVQRGASAVALVTAFGYAVFLVTPLLIGALANLLSLRIALLLTIVASIAIVLVAQRLPGRRSIG
jgi:MFS family permease